MVVFIMFDQSCFLFIDAITLSLSGDIESFKKWLWSNNYIFTPTSSRALGFEFTEKLTHSSNPDLQAFLRWGGDHMKGRFIISCQGDGSETLYNFLNVDKLNNYDPRVNRVDVALDLDGSHCFDILSHRMKRLAVSRGFKTAVAGDWIRKKDGRTLYIGSRQSTYMLRLYEKYKQSNYYDDVINERIRLELEVKPVDKHQKRRVLSMSKLDLINSAKNYKSVYNWLITDFKDEMTLSKERKMTDFDLTLMHLKKQYKNFFKLLIDKCDGDTLEFFNALTSEDN